MFDSESDHSGDLSDDDWLKFPTNMVGYPSKLVVWDPLCLDPSDGVFGRFDLGALCGCHILHVCLFYLVVA